MKGNNNMSKIADARKKAGLSQAQLSKATGIPKRTIENWESGERKPSGWVERLVIKEIESLEKRIQSEQINI